MKASLLVFIFAMLAGATFALSLHPPSARAAGCTCTASITCADVQGIAETSQSQNCCGVPTSFPHDILSFTTTRTGSSQCRKSLTVPTATGGTTCDFGTLYEPEPVGGYARCWNGQTPTSYTESFYMQRATKWGDGTLTVEVQKLDGTMCASKVGVFDGFAWCSNCADPLACIQNSCNNC